MKKPAAVAVLGTAVTLSGLFVLGKSFRWFELSGSVPRVVQPGTTKAPPSVVETDYPPRLVEYLNKADRKVEQAATSGRAALCNAALFCDARGLYLRARAVLDATRPCDADCAEVREGLEGRSSYVDARISALGKESALSRRTAAAKSAAACAGDPESCKCIDALEKLYCE